MVHASYGSKGISIRKPDQQPAPPPPLYSIHLCAMVPSHHEVTIPSPPRLLLTRIGTPLDLGYRNLLHGAELEVFRTHFCSLSLRHMEHSF